VTSHKGRFFLKALPFLTFWIHAFAGMTKTVRLFPVRHARAGGHPVFVSRAQAEPGHGCCGRATLSLPSQAEPGTEQLRILFLSSAAKNLSSLRARGQYSFLLLYQRDRPARAQFYCLFSRLAQFFARLFNQDNGGALRVCLEQFWMQVGTLPGSAAFIVIDHETHLSVLRRRA
jgi:hypothetical protein